MGSLYGYTPACTSLCQLFPFEFVEYVRNVSRLLQWRPQLGPATWPVCHTDFYFANNIEHKLKLMINIAVFCNIYCTYSTEVRTLHGQVVVSRDPPPLIWQHLISYPSLPYWIKYPPWLSITSMTLVETCHVGQHFYTWTGVVITRFEISFYKHLPYCPTR